MHHVRGGGLLAALAMVLATAAFVPGLEAQEAEAEAPHFDFYCPDCRLPLRWDQDACPQCKTEFEPLRPRTRRGEGHGYEPADPGSEGGAREGGEESPFADPNRGGGYDDASGPLVDQPWPQIQAPETARFGFGSYGRVSIQVDENLDGAPDNDIVDFGPRINKLSYQELHFYYKDVIEDLPVLVKTTLAFEEKLFHFDADFDAELAMRELYVEIEPSPDLAVWLGARMYRGDDIHLLDFWPLDDQNTVGAGAAWRVTENQRLQAHIGFNRVVDDSFFQFQQIELAQEDGVGVREAVFLDRNRITGSATWRANLDAVLLKAHLEGTYLPPGDRLVEGDIEEQLPADHGFLIGGELGYTFSPESYARLFVTYAQGLSAFDELAIPFGFDDDLQVTSAWTLRIALGGAFDGDRAGIHWGAYWQKFEDADNQDDRDDREQAAIAVRPVVYVGDYGRLGLEVSLQTQRHEGVFVETGDTETALVTQFRLLAGLGAGRGVYARPILYAFWGMDFLNEGARLELSRRFAEKPESQNHVFGIMAEWWF